MIRKFFFNPVYILNNPSNIFCSFTCKQNLIKWHTGFLSHFLVNLCIVNYFIYDCIGFGASDGMHNMKSRFYNITTFNQFFGVDAIQNLTIYFFVVKTMHTFLSMFLSSSKKQLNRCINFINNRMIILRNTILRFISNKQIKFDTSICKFMKTMIGTKNYKILANTFCTFDIFLNSRNPSSIFFIPFNLFTRFVFARMKCKSNILGFVAIIINKLFVLVN